MRCIHDWQEQLLEPGWPEWICAKCGEGRTINDDPIPGTMLAAKENLDAAAANFGETVVAAYRPAFNRFARLVRGLTMPTPPRP